MKWNYKAIGVIAIIVLILVTSVLVFGSRSSFPSGYFAPDKTLEGFTKTGFNLDQAPEGYMVRYDSSDESYPAGQFIIASECLEKSGALGCHYSDVLTEGLNPDFAKVQMFTFQNQSGVIFKSKYQEIYQLYWHDGERWLQIQAEAYPSSSKHFSPEFLISFLETFRRHP